MNTVIVETMLTLFWLGFVSLNLWLWRAPPLDAEEPHLNELKLAEGES